MSNSIVASNDIQSLIDIWLEQERNGVQFPVDFDIAWQIAGYSEKGKGKRRLTGANSHLVENVDYSIDKGKVVFAQTGKSGLSGSSSDSISMTCDAFKHFCLMARTEEGRQIRQYFIEAEKKWKLVEKVDPVFAQQIEILKLQAEIAKANASMIHDQRFVMERSEAIADLHGPQMLALIQGRPDAVVEKIERVTETVICRDGRNVSFEGKSTAEMGRELGFKTGKEFEQWLTRHNHYDLICEGFRAVSAPYVPTENISEVKRLWVKTRKSRGTQLLLGE